MSLIRLGISACLLGQEVRFDGGHKRDSFLTDELGKHVEWVPVCPEVEVGMGTPREPLQLVRVGETTRMVTTGTGIDYTDRMNEWARARVDMLERENLDGYVLKSKSPSCGVWNVQVAGIDGSSALDGRGLFASVLLERWPSLPIEEEGRLGDPTVRADFMERVLAYKRLKDHA
ncbi:MAG TPA: DUF523 domain-containing protein [Vicinamibacterales bacterium]|nr:DUF523 domain-containing protein [Vicinamibacterales bacterium]